MIKDTAPADPLRIARAQKALQFTGVFCWVQALLMLLIRGGYYPAIGYTYAALLTIGGIMLWRKKTWAVQFILILFLGSVFFGGFFGGALGGAVLIAQLVIYIYTFTHWVYLIRHEPPSRIDISDVFEAGRMLFWYITITAAALAADLQHTSLTYFVLVGAGLSYLVSRIYRRMVFDHSLWKGFLALVTPALALIFTVSLSYFVLSFFTDDRAGFLKLLAVFGVTAYVAIQFFTPHLLTTPQPYLLPALLATLVLGMDRGPLLYGSLALGVVAFGIAYRGLRSIPLRTFVYGATTLLLVIVAWTIYQDVALRTIFNPVAFGSVTREAAGITGATLMYAVVELLLLLKLTNTFTWLFFFLDKKEGRVKSVALHTEYLAAYSDVSPRWLLVSLLGGVIILGAHWLRPGLTVEAIAGLVLTLASVLLSGLSQPPPSSTPHKPLETVPNPATV
jgi:hypothetical protein